METAVSCLTIPFAPLPKRVTAGGRRGKKDMVKKKEETLEKERERNGLHRPPLSRFAEQAIKLSNSFLNGSGGGISSLA